MPPRLRSHGLLILIVVLLAAASTALIGGLVVANHGSTTAAPSLTSCEPSHEASQVVQVGLYDAGGGMMSQAPMVLGLTPSPSNASAGQVTFVVTNYGALNHEFLVLPMPADGVGTRPVGSDGKINESQSLGEASTSCGAGPGERNLDRLQELGHANAPSRQLRTPLRSAMALRRWDVRLLHRLLIPTAEQRAEPA